jgi:hypothetical protein
MPQWTRNARIYDRCSVCGRAVNIRGYYSLMVPWIACVKWDWHGTGMRVFASLQERA